MTEAVAEPQGMKKVRDLHGQLQDTVSNLSTKITVLLREREKDFLAAYRHHMYNVQKDLQDAKRSVKKAKDDLRNNDQIKKLKKERDWFRNEALRLEKLSQTQEKEIDSIQVKFNTLRDDRVWFEKQLKVAKRQIKILTAELGMQLHRGAENVNQQRPQAVSYVDVELEDGASTPGPRSYGRPGSSGSEQQNEVADLKHTIEELKDKLRDVKRKNRNLQAVVNRTTKSGQYEELFMSCVDEVKREAARRREKLLVSQRKSRKQAGLLEMHGIQVTARQELDELTVADKKKIIDNMLNEPEIFSHLYSVVFGDSVADSPQRSGLPRIE